MTIYMAIFSIFATVRNVGNLRMIAPKTHGQSFYSNGVRIQYTVSVSLID